MIKAELETKKEELISNDVSVILFKCETADKPILEKKQIDWVNDAVCGFNVNVVSFNNSVSEFEQIKANLPESKYTIVLYSFNPLLTQKNVNLCLDYLLFRQEKLIKLTYGYIFQTDYLKTINEIKEPVLFSGDASDFLKIESVQEFGYATEVLQHRILHNLINNGVNIANPANTVVNAFVKVESGATIYPFNTLMGETEILKNAVLKEGNTILNSTIGEDTIVANSIITNSTVSSNCVVFPFNTIENGSFVGVNCTIKSYNKISCAKIDDNSVVESFNNIG